MGKHILRTKYKKTWGRSEVDYSGFRKIAKAMIKCDVFTPSNITEVAMHICEISKGKNIRPTYWEPEPKQSVKRDARDDNLTKTNKRDIFLKAIDDIKNGASHP